MARILSVSYDQSLLYTRQLILEQHGHSVVSAFGFTQALKCCHEAKDFSIFILGHSISVIPFLAKTRKPLFHPSGRIVPARLSRSSGPMKAR